MAVETSRCSPISQPAATLIASVPTVTSSTEGQSEASRDRVESCTSAPITAPTSACPTRNSGAGRSSPSRAVSACTMPPTREPNSTGEGSCSAEKSGLATAVTASTTSQARSGRAEVDIATRVGATGWVVEWAKQP